VFTTYSSGPIWELVARIEVITEVKRLRDAVVHSLLAFKAKKIEQQIADNQSEIKKTESEENYEDIPLLLKKQQDLKAISKDIISSLGGL